MDTWVNFYGNIFGFRQIRFFDFEGKHSGLFSRALTSACGRIRIPIIEDRGMAGQIVEYRKRYNGEGYSILPCQRPALRGTKSRWTRWQNTAS